jgi:predicted transcriptional regulator
VFQQRLRVLACDRRLKGAHWRILAYVLSCATYAQDIRLRHREIAEALTMDAADVTRRLQDLAVFGIVARVETHRYPPTYRLNSQYIYKGRGERLEQRRAYQGKERRRG